MSNEFPLSVDWEWAAENQYGSFFVFKDEGWDTFSYSPKGDKMLIDPQLLIAEVILPDKAIVQNWGSMRARDHHQTIYESGGAGIKHIHEAFELTTEPQSRSAQTRRLRLGSCRDGFIGTLLLVQVLLLVES